MLKDFDPNSASSYLDGIFGLPCTYEDSQVIYLPIPWDATTSYLDGTSQGPQAILEASDQIDFFDLQYTDLYKQGLYMLPIEKSIIDLNKSTREQALKIINNQGDQQNINFVNKNSEVLNDHVYQKTLKILEDEKTSILIGGDHSTPFGHIKAYSEKFEEFGILHIDAHSDTRKAYLGFKHSHASIMYNCLSEIKSISSLVQVGIRDFCEEEYNYINKKNKIHCFFDESIKNHQLKGLPFDTIARDIISKLPNDVYISIDIDGLDPKYCPNTGTPVPGGLEYYELLFLINEIIRTKRRIIGADLVEVAPNKDNEWDANVGMRLLYKLSIMALASQRK